MKRPVPKLSHLAKALKAVRTAVTELRFSLALEHHSETQRLLLQHDQTELHGTVDDLVHRKAQSVANNKSRETRHPPPKVKGSWRSTMSQAELAAHKGLVPR